MRRARFTSLALACLVFVSTIVTPLSAAPIPNDDFSLEVSPSPLVATVKPGISTTINLKVHNAGRSKEQLTIESREFDTHTKDQSINLSTVASPNLRKWVHYSQDSFSVDAGAWYTQKITISLPEAAGFSYPFAVVIKRATSDTTGTEGGRILQGSIAVFALINVDKPGATRKLELSSVATTQPVYEYLPATIKLQLKNTGNSIVQPYGNIYIQNGNDVQHPLTTLALNDAKSYILPGDTKKLSAIWDDGFPIYKMDGSKPYVDWDLGDAGHFRFGHYTAKVVAVYNDGTRDVPITGEVSFWVIPWKLLLGGLIIVILILISIWTILRSISKKVRSLRAPKQP